MAGKNEMQSSIKHIIVNAAHVDFCSENCEDVICRARPRFPCEIPLLWYRTSMKAITIDIGNNALIVSRFLEISVFSDFSADCSVHFSSIGVLGVSLVDSGSGINQCIFTNDGMSRSIRKYGLDTMVCIGIDKLISLRLSSLALWIKTHARNVNMNINMGGSRVNFIIPEIIFLRL